MKIPFWPRFSTAWGKNRTNVFTKFTTFCISEGDTVNFYGIFIGGPPLWCVANLPEEVSGPEASPLCRALLLHHPHLKQSDDHIGNIIPNPIFQQSYDPPQSHLQQSDEHFSTGNITPNPTFRLCPLSRPPARVNPHGWPGRRVRIKSNISFGILPYFRSSFFSPFLMSSWWPMSPPGLRPWTSGTVRRLRDNSPTTVGPGEQINTTPLLWIVPPVPFRASVSACSHRLSNLHYDSFISSHSFSYNTDSRLLKEI